jgi:hypothetical protein
LEAIFHENGHAMLYDPPTACKECDGLAYEVSDADEATLADGLITAHAVDVIHGLVEDAKKPNPAPFFLAVGLHKVRLHHIRTCRPCAARAVKSRPIIHVRVENPPAAACAMVRAEAIL